MSIASKTGLRLGTSKSNLNLGETIKELKKYEEEEKEDEEGCLSRAAGWAPHLSRVVMEKEEPTRKVRNTMQCRQFLVGFGKSSCNQLCFPGRLERI